MKIYSDRTDYWHSVRSLGIDPSVKYIRKVKVIEDFEKYALPQNRENTNHYTRKSGVRSADIKEKFYLIGFCGKLYPLSRIEYSELNTHRSEVHYFYDKEKRDEFLVSAGFKIRDKEYRYLGNGVSVTDFFSKVIEDDSVFIEQEVPIFVIGRSIDTGVILTNYRETALVTNIILKEYEFFQVKDAYTSFQDVSTYLQNQLVKENPITVIEDKYQITAKGFDMKTSFRHPTQLSKIK